MLLAIGFVGWLAATVALRLIGSRLLQPHPPVFICTLFGLSFLLMVLLMRRCGLRLKLAPEEWPRAGISLALPMLLLDPFSSAFFTIVFPNASPEAAGMFGGWMLICCAGLVVGAVIRR